MAPTQHHQLKVGDSVQIKRGFITRIDLLYAGMPSDRTFSLVVTKTGGHMGMAYNLYLPTSERHLDLAKTPITIHGVSATTLQLAIDKPTGPRHFSIRSVGWVLDPRARATGYLRAHS